MGHASRLAALLLGAAALGGSLAQPASAVTMQAVYTGTVLNSIDRTNRFGAGSSLDGLAFRAVFIYDPATPGASRNTTSTTDEVTGGTLLGVPSPMQSIKLTINRHSESFHPSFFANVEAANVDGSFGTIFQDGVHARELVGGQAISSVNARAGGGLFPASLDSSIPLTSLGPPGVLRGTFDFLQCTFEPSGACFIDQTTRTTGSLSASSVRVAPIPVPAALPLLASGLAAFGIVAFRRRREGTRATA
jgi:hypothetical protein